MGCDIHIQIERRVKGTWQRVPWVDDFRRQYPQFYPDVYAESPLVMPDQFERRNYNLFGVLANVRNGTWGDPLPPIAAPRGAPSDSSIHDDDLLGEHSLSYVTLAELITYPWDETVQMCGWVSEEVAQQVETTGIPPKTYAGWANTGRPVRWIETRRHAVRYWPDTIVPILSTLGTPDAVRLVFGFDS